MYQCMLLLPDIPLLIDPLELLHFYQNEIIDSSLYYIFHINLAIEWVIIVSPFQIQSITFFLDYFFNSEFFFACLLKLFFMRYSNNFFTIGIANNVCSLITKTSLDQFAVQLFVKKCLYFGIPIWSPTLNLRSLSLF